MNFLQIAGRDIKTIFKNRIIRVSIIAIIIVPLLYSLLYLDAFWDPYSKLENMPVAVVNLDKGTVVDGEKVNYGDGVVDNLRDSTEVGWKFVSEEEATKGLEGNDYYAIFEITDDFSEKVVSAKEGTPEMAGLKFICNEKKNFLAAQVSTKIQSALKEKITSTITNNYVKVAFDNLYKAKDGMTEAADGSKKINDGVKTLNGKIPELVDGVTKLKDGSEKANDGQIKLNFGINDLYNGIGEAQAGVKRLNNGLSDLNGKVPALVSGITQLYNGSNLLTNNKGKDTTAYKAGMQELVKGTQDFYTGYKTQVVPGIWQVKAGADLILTKMSEGSEGIALLSKGASECKTFSPAIAAGSTQIKVEYSKVESGVNKVIESTKASKTTMEKISGDLQAAYAETDETKKNQEIAVALGELKAYNDHYNVNDAEGNTPEQQIKNLSQGLSDLQEGINKYDVNIINYTNGVTKLSDGTSDLITSVGNVQKGVSQISNGVVNLQGKLASDFAPGFVKANEGAIKLNDKFTGINDACIGINEGLAKMNENVPSLSQGAPQLYSGSNDLLDGVNKLYDGSSKAVDGSKDLVDGQGQLKDGISTLNSKVPDLKDGITKLYDGTSELATKLSDGATKLDKGLVNTSGDMADFVSKPVEMKVEPINAVPNYGTGFAPYFMNLSLWIGAIMMFFVISSKTDEYEGVSRVHKALGKYLSFAFIGVIQAVLVGIAVLWLGLKPESVPVYFGILIFCSLVFISIVQFLISIFGDAGRLLSIVFLILQLTACAGTFPLELVPGFFKVLNPFMPFTYAVEALREICSATVINYGIIAKDAGILGIFFVIFLGGSIILKHTGDKIQKIMEGKKEEAFENQ